MFGSIFHQIRNTTTSAASNVTDARNAAEQVTRRLETRLDHLELACAGLWELLKSKHGYSDDDLISVIQMVDARDGSIDGKVARAAKTCPHCHRKLLTRDSPKCSWCGTDLPVGLS